MNIFDTTIDIHDRGLQYGDGLFETMRVQSSRIPLLEYHLQRLAQGLAVLKIEGVAIDALEKTCIAHASRQPDSVLKLIVTRGRSTRRGYNPAGCDQPSVCLLASDLPDTREWQNDGVALTLCETRLPIDPKLAGLKHLNRLHQVLARAEWQDPAIFDGLMLDTRDHLVEGTMCNVFLKMDNRWLTPRISGGVQGVMRRVALELASAHDIPIAETDIPGNELDKVTHGFICNAVVGILPIRGVAGRTVPIDNDTRTLVAAANTLFA